MATLVLGGSGFIGSKVVKEFTGRGVETLSYDVVESNLAGKEAKWVKADISDPLTLERVFFEYDVDTVVHLIGLPDIAQCEKDPQLSFQLNVLSLQNTLEPMRKADVGNVLFASSAAVYGYDSPTPVPESSPLSPTSVYGHHKMIGEKMLESYARSYGLKFTALRLFNVYGANPATGKDVISIFIRRAMSKQPISVKGPGKFRDFIHVDDVVDIVGKLAQKPQSSTAINVGTGKRVTLGEIAESISEHFPGVEVVKETVPDDGKGIVADNSRLAGAIDIKFRDSATGIDRHIGNFASGRS